MKERKLKCDKCNYEWNTKSRMMYVSCPQCLKKVDIEKNLVKRRVKKIIEKVNPNENQNENK